jgi:hypothetical protein
MDEDGPRITSFKNCFIDAVCRDAGLCLLAADSRFEDGESGGRSEVSNGLVLEVVCPYAGRTRRRRALGTNLEGARGCAGAPDGSWGGDVAGNENLRCGCLGGQSVSVGSDGNPGSGRVAVSGEHDVCDLTALIEHPAQVRPAA